MARVEAITKDWQLDGEATGHPREGGQHQGALPEQGISRVNCTPPGRSTGRRCCLNVLVAKRQTRQLSGTQLVRVV